MVLLWSGVADPWFESHAIKRVGYSRLEPELVYHIGQVSCVKILV